MNYVANVNGELKLDNVKDYAVKWKIEVDENLEQEVFMYKIQTDYMATYAKLRANPSLGTIYECIKTEHDNISDKLANELMIKALELCYSEENRSAEDYLVMYDVANRLYKLKAML
jgi:hypothetical protein